MLDHQQPTVGLISQSTLALLRSEHKHKSWGLGIATLQILGLRCLHEILLYPGIQDIQEYEMRTLSKVMTFQSKIYLMERRVYIK